MKKKLRIALAQLNLTAGDLHGNLNKHVEAAKTARDTLHADVIVYPELSLTGYLHEDLVFRKAFIDNTLSTLNEFITKIQGIYCIIGHPLPKEAGLFNACSVIYNGKILSQYAKQHLPNYGVFDECRYYQPGNQTSVVSIAGVPVGITICEDLWYDRPIQRAAEQGARLILSPNASPFEIDKQERRQQVLSERAKANNLPIVYVNHACGQDELVFDGGSMLVDQHGNLCYHAGFFKEELSYVDIDFSEGSHITSPVVPWIIPSATERIYEALTFGLRDYVQKNQFSGALVGLSGGIDSALTLAIAADALGKEHVTAVLMPSRYTAEISYEDAIATADYLGVSYQVISIEPVYQQFLKILGSEDKITVTEENLQSRCRGTILMALSNQLDRIVISTGNRSEMAVGYATLYGDMVGGISVLKDVTKTWVYRLAQYRNQLGRVIPERTLHRPPTAELSPNQKDEDSLPPYDILDPILEYYLNEELSIDDIAARGFDKNVVAHVVQLIQKSEYKRRQAPIGIRINHHAFGRDRRYPITLTPTPLPSQKTLR